MSAEVAIQGIAQDYITLFLGIPLLAGSLFFTVRRSLTARFILAGTLFYFFVTCLFYLVMAMYNELFLVYTILLGTSSFALGLILFSFDLNALKGHFSADEPLKSGGVFLQNNAVPIGFLWLSAIVLPLPDGSIYPQAVEHYTTLIVQGLDLGILLPLSFYSGFLLFKKKRAGFLPGPVCLIFLSLLMTALVAKIIFMGFHGYNIIPAIFIIPLIAVISVGLSCKLLQDLKAIKPTETKFSFPKQSLI